MRIRMAQDIREQPATIRVIGVGGGGGLVGVGVASNTQQFVGEFEHTHTLLIALHVSFDEQTPIVLQASSQGK